MPLLQAFIAQGFGSFLGHNVPLRFVTSQFLMEMIFYWIAKTDKMDIVLISLGLAVANYCFITYFEGWDVTPFFYGILMWLVWVLYFMLLVIF